MASRTPAPMDVTAAQLAAITLNDEPVGQRFIVTDDGEKEYEVRGPDGARTLHLLHVGHVDDHEAALDPHPDYVSQAELDAALTETHVWMPLTTVVGGVPELVWEDDDSLIPTKVPIL